jgi:hypothetical protein
MADGGVLRLKVAEADLDRDLASDRDELREELRDFDASAELDTTDTLSELLWLCVAEALSDAELLVATDAVTDPDRVDE